MDKRVKIYLIGSLRNPAIPEIANNLRGFGHEVFDDWFAAGPEADDKWREYEQQRGRSFQEALAGHAAVNIFNFDKRHLDNADAALMVFPCGRSGHLELGYLSGKGKPTYVYYPEGEPERWDVMYQFTSGVFTDFEELLRKLLNASSH
jgi:nucleoside 2-deoxyribosyltransferase